MRIKRIGLEHHGDVALARGHAIDHPVADENIPIGDLLQPGDHAQKRGLAAAGWTDQRDEFTIRYIKRDAVDDIERRIGLADTLKFDGSHFLLLSRHDLTAPAVRPAMMCFCARKKTMTVGRIVSVMKARTSCHSVPNSPR
ncbi:hypothetical protein D3C86_1766160 [compost metagenome]